jgi:ABC-2 type transport system ATP-binding protein
MIEFQGLSKRYGEYDAVKPLNLAVKRGEVFGFLGPNGAGKTTTIKMMMGLLVPSAGHVHIAGFDCHADGAEVKRHIGYLPDNPVFYDYLRGPEILRFVARMHGLSAQQAHTRAERLIHEFDLEEAGDEFAVNYSLGMKKKLGLACALIHEPDVLILDEPINGLDPRAARDVNDKLQTYAQRGATIFVSTHLLDMAERQCDRLGIIHRGQLIATGSVDELRAANASNSSLEELFLELTSEEPHVAPLLARAS